MTHKISRILVILTLAFAFFASSSASAQPNLNFTGGVEQSPNGIYIVQMISDPVVAYEGDIQGFKATRPNPGERINPDSLDVVKYAGYLRSKHDEALNKAGGQKLYDYVYSFNGFAAHMSEQQASKLAAVEGVLNVSADELQTVDTSSTPTFLGLDAEGGLWDQLGGVGSAGEGIIIGIVDSGIWPESLSFTDRVDRNGDPSSERGSKLAYRQIHGWHGKCKPGEDYNASMCNHKLVGAQWFNAAWGGDAALEAERPWEFMSARDYNGHGTHTSSTAGGNHGVPTTGPATLFGDISGMALRARIAMYKALWSTEDASTASGFTSDLVAAIDQAVADGVDVINYSISGTLTNFLDPVQVSFLFAADAGVFVAASAGNSGPGSSTVAHPGPWLTTVAAGTHNRAGIGSVTLGNGDTYEGASVAAIEVSAPLVRSSAVGLSGEDPDEVTLCYPGTLDPALVTGKIVLCDRGVIARVDKSLAVEMAGGVGMILANVEPSSLNADFHFVPTVHVDEVAGAAIKAYIDADPASATATILQATIVYDAPAPFTASFSSRGPLRAGGGDLLKPDVIAPGVDILAAVAPPGNHGFDFNLYSGTSMSSPHVAGLAALLKDLHPDWSPMAIKSALMTTGYDVLDSVDTSTKIFSEGAGHVQPNSAADPGLVYDSDFFDWLAFLCGTTTGVSPSTCTALAGLGYSFDPSDMNVASIAIGDLAGIQTVTRRVTNVGGSPATYNASVSGLDGIDVAISPSSLTLGPGETGEFEVTFTTTTAALNSYAGGYLTWSDGSHNVRIPLVIRPVALAAPAEVSGTGDPISYDVVFGYTGSFAATPRGLIPATTTPGSVPQDPDQSFDPEDPEGTVAVPVTIAADTTYARFQLFNEDVAPGSDIDLYVYRGDTLVGASTTGTSAEQVNLVNPAADDYTVYIHGWGLTADPSPFVLYTWLLGTADEGNMTVSAPDTATIGETGTIELTFTGLDPATKYLGSVAYSDGVNPLPTLPTIVRVDTP